MTEIQQKYQALGGEQGPLGRAVNEEQATPNGLGFFQDFEHGMIFYHADYGAHVLSEAVENKWKSSMLANDMVTGTQQAIRDYMGFPISDTLPTGERGEACYFERGMIVVRASGSSVVIYGECYQAYRAHGDLQGALGLPLNDQRLSAGGGYAVQCDQADIYWHPATGAFEVHGAILQKYRSMGTENAFLGYPISDEQPVFNGSQQIGAVSHFQSGTIYWSAATGAHEVHGDLLTAYQTHHHGPAGELGFPLSDETNSPNDVCRFNNFQHGILVWQAANRQVSLINRLKLVVTRLETDEDDDDLLVRTQVLIDHVQGQQKRFEKQFGEYSNQGTKTFSNPDEGFICDCPINDGNAILTVNMQAFDVDAGLNFNDDLIAQFSKSFGIETLWDSSLPDLQGNDLGSFARGPDGKFRASFTVFTDQRVVDPTDSSHFRENLFWSFKNPKIAELSFDTCAATFSDLEADDTWLFHPFNKAFYETVYKGAAKTGTCFGMCLEAIYALKGVSSSRPFISQYGFDAQRTRDISIKFGYQLGGSQVGYMIDAIKSGRMWDPVQNFEFSQAAFEQKNYSLLCLSEDISPVGGHVVLPYRWEKRSDEEWRIYVANPNSPFPKSNSNEGGDKVITINPKTNTFVYQHGKEKTWKGGQGLFNGGRMFAMPFSELSTQPRTPFWEAFLTFITGGMYLIFASDSSELEQVSNEQGETLINADGSLNTDRVTRIKNLFPVEHHAQRTFSDVARQVGKIKTSRNLSQLFKRQQFNLYYLNQPLVRGKMYPDVVLHVNPDLVRTFPRQAPEQSSTAQRIGKLSTKFKTGIHTQPLTHSAASDTTQTVARDVSEHVQSSAMLGEVLRNKRALTLKVRNQAQGDYQLGFISGGAKLMLTANSIQNSSDMVTLSLAGSRQQSFVFQAGDQTANKQLTLTLTSYDNQRRYELSGLQLQAQQTIQLQHDNACRSVRLQSAGQPVAFDLKVFVNHQSAAAMSKRVEFPADVALNFSPLDWTALEQGAVDTALELQLINPLDGKLIETRRL
ncbi:LGFP repeat-containing protein [Methylophilus sp. OH31]|uniref:LGFP repeat-containing protein n=1 Tax=Methylophilus sp. OH31 TaxID=1387312 RepID=UPI00046533E3|nr:hypothetical protein [Methylophilus sp. OH31]